MKREVTVNMGEMAIGGGDLILQTNGVGSCLVITMFDDVIKIGGLAHAMLPGRHVAGIAVTKILQEKDGIYTGEAKYVEEAMERLVTGIVEQGGVAERLHVKLIGGARMFHLLTASNFTVGMQNVESAKTKLLDMQIPLESEDTGGTIGRSVGIDLSNGLVTVRSVM
jgi:chemotaxis protein CheD